MNVLQGKASFAQREVVLSNAAMAISCYKPQQPYTDCKMEAAAALDSGKAFEIFKKLVA